MTRSLANFSSWLLDAFVFLAITIINYGVDVINAAIEGIAAVFSVLLAVLPDASLDLSPPQELLSAASGINWFIPMGAISGSISLVCASYVAFFAIRPVAKFLHLA